MQRENCFSVHSTVRFTSKQQKKNDTKINQSLIITFPLIVSSNGTLASGIFFSLRSPISLRRGTHFADLIGEFGALYVSSGYVWVYVYVFAKV